MYSLNTRITKAENEFDNNSKQLNEQKQIRRHNILKGIDGRYDFCTHVYFRPLQ